MKRRDTLTGLSIVLRILQSMLIAGLLLLFFLSSSWGRGGDGDRPIPHPKFRPPTPTYLCDLEKIQRRGSYVLQMNMQEWSIYQHLSDADREKFWLRVSLRIGCQF